MLPNKIPDYIMEKYVRCGAFSSSPVEFIHKWYDMQIALQNTQLESFLHVGVGVNQECKVWNGLMSDLFDTSYFLNIEIDEGIYRRAKGSSDPLLNCELCDVRNVENFLAEDALDGVLWSHGPEHIHRSDWEETLQGLEWVAKNAVILQCPWGNAYDGDVGHYAQSIQEDEFKQFGYKVLTMGNKDTRYANLLAYKVL